MPRIGTAFQKGDFMSIESRRELELTQTKLKLLEERLTALAQKPDQNRRAREWTVRSLTQTINQMKEEIARFESRAKDATQEGFGSATRTL